VRATVWVLAATLIVTDASPCPADGLTCTHAASLVADHEHSRAACTVAENCAPPAGTFDDVVDNVVWQRAGSGPDNSVMLVLPQPVASQAATAAVANAHELGGRMTRPNAWFRPSPVLRFGP
jgi:hypothetical protein